MSSSNPPSGVVSTAVGRIVGPTLDKIIKSAPWRKHTHLVSSSKSSLDLLHSPSPSSSTTSSDPASVSPLLAVPPSFSDAILSSLLLALESSTPRLVDPALDCLIQLTYQRLLSAEVNSNSSVILSKVFESVINLSKIEDDAIELMMLKFFLTAIRSELVLIRGEMLVQIVKSCYNVYLGSQALLNQVLAKLVLAQILMIVYARVEANEMDVKVKTVEAVDMLDLSERSLQDSNLMQTAQGFIDEVMRLNASGGRNGDVKLDFLGEGEESKIREDGIFLFKNMCKFSMKFAGLDEPEDPLLLRGKVLSLELLKMIMEGAGSIWRTNDKFLGAIKQYLCLSLLKNSALSAMSIFQLLCSIFMILLSKLRSGLKSEIGVFFPMLILRVLENVLQPSFLQKMTVLNLLEKICQDPQTLIDIFVNYDCDVEAPNIFERIVNGLLKTALGVPPGSATTLSPAQDSTFRIESVKCLTNIIKSMGTWMDQQLKIENNIPGTPESDHSKDSFGSISNGEDFDLHSDAIPEQYNAATLEQRRVYKLELQKGISLFNRKPSKGIQFLTSTKKIGGSPEEVANFLKTTAGLNETMIGDYLGERDDFPLKVMHAYVDSMKFEGMDFGEAIRYFLRGFKLPGEAQKIDRIMEKFAERYCKCNPSSFTSADTAYVLAYSVILLNTDAHNNMVKNKMSKADFLRNNRGIDDGKDLPEEYLGSLYDQIVKNEIKMKADSSAAQSKQVSSNKLLGLDNIFSLVNWTQSEEKAIGASDMLIKNIQEQFKAKNRKSESAFYTVTEVGILRFMMEVCWAPMMAAFSVTLDQSDDKEATSQCLLGFRYAVHVTSVMCMQTQRDAFVTSIAKFTYLHNAADMKQKNVDALKAIISIAIEDGNHLQEAWEHFLTCLSRFEHLHLLGEGAPSDASFLISDQEDKSQQASSVPNSKRKNNMLQTSAVMAVVRGGSYDSKSVGVNTSGLVTPEQINSFISNLNLLDQIGSSELNHVFAHSQRLNGDAIVAFVKALCKVAIVELQSPTDPRVFSLTKIVEIAHYNMNRIRLVWSWIWTVLSDFFVSVGLSENLSVAIFVIDSLRQLAMKFLEREELVNYNFQNEFLRPFVVIMQKSNSLEIREIIVQCISQMVLSRVNNVKSGWKSVFTIFTAAAADERKTIVLLAFETMEKIVRDYFPYITETETTTFTDCVKCLITFTNSRFNNDASLNAIAFLRFCAVKLAEGGLVCSDKNVNCHLENGEEAPPEHKDDQTYLWVPLLSGLSNLTSDPRRAIRKGALEVLFDILKDHGDLFSHSFWSNIFESIINPMFQKIHYMLDQFTMSTRSSNLEDNSWNPETTSIAAQSLADLFINKFDTLHPQFQNVVYNLTSIIISPHQQYSQIGVFVLLHLMDSIGKRLSEEEWREVLLLLEKANAFSLSVYLRIVDVMCKVDVPKSIQGHSDVECYSDFDDEGEGDNMEAASCTVVRLSGHVAVQLLIIKAITKLYEVHHEYFSVHTIKIILEILSSMVSHASEVNSNTDLQKKLKRACSVLEITYPPIVLLEKESYSNYLKLLDILLNNSPISGELAIETHLVTTCVKILELYLKRAEFEQNKLYHWTLPLGRSKKAELLEMTPLLVLTLTVLGGLENKLFRRNLPCFFPLLSKLVCCEHSSGEVPKALYDIFQMSIGPMVLNI